MKGIRLRVFVALFTVAASLEAQRVQSRIGVHPTYGADGHWLVTAWVVGNVIEAQSGNTNLMTGIGYRTDRYWVEALSWKRWGHKANGWGADTRFGAAVSQFSLYGELGVVPVTRDKLFFATADYMVNKKWKIGLETEDVLKKRGWSLAGGPRLSYAWKGRIPIPIMTTLAYHVREGPDIARLYLVIHPKF